MSFKFIKEYKDNFEADPLTNPFTKRRIKLGGKTQRELFKRFRECEGSMNEDDNNLKNIHIESQDSFKSKPSRNQMSRLMSNGLQQTRRPTNSIVTDSMTATKNKNPNNITTTTPSNTIRSRKVPNQHVLNQRYLPSLNYNNNNNNNPNNIARNSGVYRQHHRPFHNNRILNHNNSNYDDPNPDLKQDNTLYMPVSDFTHSLQPMRHNNDYYDKDYHDNDNAIIYNNHMPSNTLTTSSQLSVDYKDQDIDVKEAYVFSILEKGARCDDVCKDYARQTVAKKAYEINRLTSLL